MLQCFFGWESVVRIEFQEALQERNHLSVCGRVNCFKFAFVPMRARHLEVAEGTIISDEWCVRFLRRANRAADVLYLVARAKMNIISLNAVQLRFHHVTVAIGWQWIAWVTWEQDPILLFQFMRVYWFETMQHFCKNASYAPHVDFLSVFLFQ